MQVLLLDEVTVDLDVLARSIFDGLDDWPTHIVSSLVSHSR
jgi:ATPase subunit of ABC transporter with duplicated ATPase domains